MLVTKYVHGARKWINPLLNIFELKHHEQKLDILAQALTRGSLHYDLNMSSINKFQETLLGINALAIFMVEKKIHKTLTLFEWGKNNLMH